MTVSWNRFSNHDKMMLIGSSDSGSTANGDVGKLNVTIHHNLFDRLVQRMPRVRFGKVHLYNNYYVVGDDFSYAWGVGVASQIFAENNFFEVEGQRRPASSSTGTRSRRQRWNGRPSASMWAKRWSTAPPSRTA